MGAPPRRPGVAARLEGRGFIGTETAPEYIEIARERLGAAGTNVELKAFRAGQESLFGPF
jgi:DNA modification methylase